MANMGASQSILDELGANDDEPAPPATPPTTPDPNTPAPVPEAIVAPAAPVTGTPPATPPAPVTPPAPDVPQGFVPHAALHEERLRNRDLKLKLEEVSEKLGIVDTLRTQLDEYRKAGKTTQPQDPAPNKEEDPIAFLEWENRQLRRDVNTILDRDKAVEQSTIKQDALNKQFQKLTTETQEQVAEFEKVQPDYSHAFRFVVNARLNDYKAMGFTNPTEAQRMLDQEILQMAAASLHRGVNPGKAAYDLAVSRGYKPAAPAAPAAPNSLTEQLNRLEKGGKAGSMGAGGVAPENNLDLAAIDAMSDAEFDAYWAKQFGSNSIY